MIETPEGTVAWALCGPACPAPCLTLPLLPALGADCLCLLELVLARRPRCTLIVLVLHVVTACLVSQWLQHQTRINQTSDLHPVSGVLRLGAVQPQYSSCALCHNLITAAWYM